MKVAVASFDRPEGCRDKTLAFLKRTGWPARDIYVFVANAAEQRRYASVLERGTYGKLVIGRPGLGAQKNFMSTYFSEGEPVLHMDDDVQSVVQLVKRPGQRNDAKEVTDLRGYAKWAFALCRRYGCRLWGIQMTANAFFLRPTATVGWALVSGPLYGQINTRDKRFRIPRTDGIQDDVERSLQHITAFGNVVRLNALGMKTKWHGPGGLQSVFTLRQRHTVSIQHARDLIKAYPKHLKSIKIAEFPHDVDFKFHRSPAHLVVPMPLLG